MKTIIITAKVIAIEHNGLTVQVSDILGNHDKPWTLKTIPVVLPFGIECFPNNDEIVAVSINVHRDGSITNPLVLGLVQHNSKPSQNINVTKKIRCADLFAKSIASDSGNQLFAKTAFDSHFHSASGAPPTVAHSSIL